MTEEIDIYRAAKVLIDHHCQPVQPSGTSSVRVDDQTAVDIGQGLGVTLFQGFYIDRLLSNRTSGAA